MTQTPQKQEDLSGQTWTEPLGEEEFDRRATPQTPGFNVEAPQPQAPGQIDVQQLMTQYGISPESVQANMGGTQQWLEDNVYVPLGARLRGRSEEEERAWRLQQQAEWQARGADYDQQLNEAGGATAVARETTRAVLGGGQDAFKSLGEFADI